MATNPLIDVTETGSLTTMIVSFFSGIVLSFNEGMFLTWDFPPVLLHSLQILAWIVAIITGIITIYKHIKGKK